MARCRAVQAKQDVKSDDPVHVPGVATTRPFGPAGGSGCGSPGGTIGPVAWHGR